jgi:predicted nucleotidyltransferase
MSAPRHGLPSAAIDRVVDTLGRFPAVERAVLFGSRAKGTAKTGSDIDLALYGEALDWREVGRLADALDDLLLPYRFSLIRHDSTLDPDVAAHIARAGIPLFVREAAPA